MAPVPMLPRLHLGEESLAVGSRVDGHDVEKQGAQMFGVRAFGIAPAPTQSLPLNMDQAALNPDGGPHEP